MFKLGYYQHYKNRKFYEITGIATHQDGCDKDGKQIVEYRDAETGKKYTRFSVEFFAVVMMKGVIPVSRFKYVGKKL